MLKQAITALLLVFSIVMYGESVLYARIVEDDFVPVILGRESGFLKLSCVNEDFNNVLQQYHFHKFWQAWPGIKSEYLQAVYIIELNSEEEEAHFMQCVVENYSEQIPTIEKIGEPYLDDSVSQQRAESGNAAYNLQGVPVMNEYHGIIVKRGCKYITIK